MNNSKGMTLVEVLAALTISTLVMGMLFGVFMTGMASFNEQSRSRQVRADADYVMAMIANAFYDKNGQITVSEENGRILLNGKPISQPNLDYSGSMFEFDKNTYTLHITLKVAHSGSGRSAGPFTLTTVLHYPW